MRLGVVVGAALIVIIVGVLAALSLRPAHAPAPNPLAETPSTGSPGSGQFFQAIPSDAPEAAASPTAAGATISITEAGFSPATLTVTAGTEVIFVNNGQAQHWPESDIFNSQRGLETGETYSYTFDKTGTWRCQDHLLPQNTCTIIVE